MLKRQCPNALVVLAAGDAAFTITEASFAQVRSEFSGRGMNTLWAAKEITSAFTCLACKVQQDFVPQVQVKPPMHTAIGKLFSPRPFAPDGYAGATGAGVRTGHFEPATASIQRSLL
jgi:hypothetical protein